MLPLTDCRRLRQSLQHTTGKSIVYTKSGSGKWKVPASHHWFSPAPVLRDGPPKLSASGLHHCCPTNETPRTRKQWVGCGVGKALPCCVPTSFASVERGEGSERLRQCLVPLSPWPKLRSGGNKAADTMHSSDKTKHIIKSTTFTTY